jgi:cytochrome c oxidase assembly factor CtaG
MSDDDRRGLSTFFSLYVCDHDVQITIAMSISVVFFVFSLAGVVFMDSSAKSYPIALLNAFVLGAFTLAFGSLAAYCARQEDGW